MRGAAARCLASHCFDSAVYITEKSEDSLIILKDIEGETVTIIISAPDDKFVEFLPSARKVLQTVEWEGD